MNDNNLQEYMAEIMSAEYRQVIDNMLLNNDINPLKVKEWHSMKYHEVEVDFDGD